VTDERRDHDDGRELAGPPATGLQIGSSVTAVVVTGLLGLVFSVIDLALMLFVANTMGAVLGAVLGVVLLAAAARRRA
jgi:hypothetical protein